MPVVRSGEARLFSASAVIILLCSVLLSGSFETNSLAAKLKKSRPYPAVLKPSTGEYFGAYVSPRSGENYESAVVRLESQAGRKLAIDHQYYKWNQPVPTSHQYWDANTGRLPFVNWKAQRTDGSVVPWSAIANGSQDSWIIQRANAFKAFKSPIYLTFHHEPENDLARFGTAADYAAAFRHIVTVFRNQGVTNVAFVWTMMSWTFDPRSGRVPSSYYPGDDYVDFIGSDGYNWYPGRRGAPWDSFQQIFSGTNTFAVAHHKPWMVVELGAQEDPAQAGRKGTWFKSILPTARSWPSLKAIIYFDTVTDYAWIADSSTSSIQGFAALGHDPLMYGK